MKTVVGIFNDAAEARRAVQELMDHGISRDNIWVMTDTVENPQVIYEKPDEISAAASHVDVDAKDGEHLRHLVELGVTPADARLYLDELKRESVLIAVIANDDGVDRVVDILAPYRPIDIDHLPVTSRENDRPDAVVSEKRDKRDNIQIYLYPTRRATA